MAIDFRLIEFNPRRFERGAEAARVAVIEDGQEGWLWMSAEDIRNNLREFGENLELRRALGAYFAAGKRLPRSLGK